MLTEVPWLCNFFPDRKLLYCAPFTQKESSCVVQIAEFKGNSLDKLTLYGKFGI